MANTLTALVSAVFNPKLATTFGTLSPSIPMGRQFTNGTAINQSDVIFCQQRTIADNVTPDSLDLSGSLLDPSGSAAVFAKVTAIAVKSLTTTAAEILSMGGGSNAFSSWLDTAAAKLIIGPDGFLLLSNPSLAGYAVTAGTGDILRMATASGTNVKYIIGILGRSA